MTARKVTQLQILKYTSWKVYNSLSKRAKKQCVQLDLLAIENFLPVLNFNMHLIINKNEFWKAKGEERKKALR